MESKKSKRQSNKLFNENLKGLFFLVGTKDSFSSLKMQISHFYIYGMSKFIKKYKRSFPISIFLLLVYFAQITASFFTLEIKDSLLSHSQNQQQFLKQVIKYFQFTMLYPIYASIRGDDTYNRTQITRPNMEFLILSACLNAILLFVILIQFKMYVVSNFTKDESASSQQQQSAPRITTSNTDQKIETNFKNEGFSDTFNFACSFVFRTYSFLAVLPFIELSLCFTLQRGQIEDSNSSVTSFDSAISSFVLISTIFIFWIIQIKEFDYSIISLDCLAQKRSHYQYVQIFADILNCLLQLNINIQLSLINLSIQLAFQLSSEELFNDSTYASFSVLACCFMTLSWKVGERLHEYCLQKGSYALPFLEFENNISANKFERYIRSNGELFTLLYEAYMREGAGEKFETIYANHIINCHDKASLSAEFSPACFCERFTNSNTHFLNKQSKDKVHTTIKQKNIYLLSEHDCDELVTQAVNNKIGFEFRRNFLILYLIHSVNTFFTSSTKNAHDADLKLKPTFIYFLLEIAKSPSKAYLEIFYLLQQMKTSTLQQKSVIQDVIQDIQDAFRLSIRNSPFQNQRLQISQVIKFDRQFEEFQSMLKDGMIQKLRFFEFLYSDVINLSNLEKFSQDCLKSKTQLEKKLILLFDINPRHAKIAGIAEIYIEFFDFQKRRVRHFMRNSKEIMKRNLHKVDFKVDLFAEDTCCIFISLQSKKIIAASQSARVFFQKSIQDLIGKPFQSLIPNFTSQSLIQAIDQFLEEGNVDPIKIGELFTFLLNPNSPLLIIPVYLRIKIDILIDGQFGLAMYIQKTDSMKRSICVDEKFQFRSCTSQAKKLLLNSFEQREEAVKISRRIEILKQLNLKNAIPLLYSLDEKDYSEMNDFQGYNEQLGFNDQRTQNYKTYSSLLIVPKRKDHAIRLNMKVPENPVEIMNYYKRLPWSELVYFEIIFAVLNLNAFTNKENNIKVINITSVRILSKSFEINDNLLHLSEQLSIRFGYPIQFPQFVVYSQEKPKQERTKMTNIPPTSLQNSPKKLESRNSILSTFRSQEEHNLNTERTYLGNYHSEESQIVLRLSNKKQKNEQNIEELNKNKMQQSSQQESFLLTKRSTSTKNMNEISQTYPHPLSINEFDQIQLTQIIQNQFSPMALSPTERLLKSDQQIGSKSTSLISEDSFSIKKKRLLQDHHLKEDSCQIDRKQPVISQAWRLAQSHLVDAVKEMQIRQSNNFMRITQDNYQNENTLYEDDSSSVSGNQIYNEVKTLQKQTSMKQVKTVNDSLSSQSDEQEKNKRLHRFEDQHSIRSGQSQIFSQKQSLYEMIISTQESRQILYSRLFGYFAYLVLQIIISLLFFSVKQNYDDLLMNYQNLTLGPEISESFTQILHIKELVSVISINSYFGYLNSKFTKEDVANFQVEAEKKLSRLTSQVGELQRYHIRSGFEDFFLYNQQIIIYVDDVLKEQRKYMNHTRLYETEVFILNLNDYLFRGTVNARRFIYYNYEGFVRNMNILSTVSQENADEKLKSTEKLFFLSIALIEAITLAVVVLVFPIYYMVQVKKQEILNLLVTFDSNNLKGIILKHRDVLKLEMFAQISSRSSTQSNKPRKSMIIDQQQMTANRENQDDLFLSALVGNQKKKTISQTSSIPKYSINLIIGTFTIFFLISLYSLMNYLFTKNFFSNLHYHIEELSLLEETKCGLSINFTGMYILLNSYAYKFSQADIASILNFMINIQHPKDQIRIEQFYSLENNFIDTRYQLSDYYSNFLQIIKDNACPMLSSSFANGFVQEDNVFLKNFNCTHVSGGVLKQGTLVSLKDFYGKVSTFLSTYTSTKGLVNYFYALHQWDSDNNLKEFEMEYYNLRTILNAQIAFLLDTSTQYFSYLQNMSLILFIYSMIILSLVFWLLWRKFIFKMVSSISSTMLLLSIMPIEHLLENPYVLSYIQKQKRIVKQR